ncbi:hypothetical protein PSH79_08785 [Pseudomonas sp. FP2196]|uniref:hypothetical protein n=1 Tax=Pseudomonas sp. FP2196 TaxID=2954086 RepID=UPI0027335A89|nr:hypothetical protein [Pseudomonas sp. FP2196]WLH37384.1 hypothetical protein PSH79_08785 [Pseudomonas sp. FP2196]
MAKPPKKISGSIDADKPVKSATPVPDPPSGHPRLTNPPETYLSGSELTPDIPFSNATKGPDALLPRVVINEMPAPHIESYQSASGEIAWPKERYAELVPFGTETGLYKGPDARIYAEIGAEGRFLVEQNPQGVYHVPLSFAPGVPGPILAKIAGQPRWRIERPGWQSPPKPSQSPPYIAPELATLLTRAELSADGIRYDKHKKTYVDLAEGTVMVGKNRAGVYQETSASELSPSGAEVELIPGMKLWRRKAQDLPREQTPPASAPHPAAESDEPTPHPGKRPRLDEAQDTAHSPTADTAPSPDQTPYFWLSWGLLNQPTSGESVQLGWLHYPIVPMGTAPNRLPKVYFLQHPEFAPAHFDAFEHMLQQAPSLQPVATFRIGHEPGEVRPGKRFFEKPLSQSVAETFVDFSAFTSRAVARRIFELSDDSPVITATGLINIQAVLHQWNQKPFPTTPAFADPMNMLPVASIIEADGIKAIKLKPQVEGELQRLTFDPQHFAFEWKHYKTDPTDYNLRRLIGALLIRSGYDVFPLTHEHRRPALVFRRESHDKVFFLTLGVIQHDVVVHHTVPGTELADPALPDRIGSAAHLALKTAQAQNNVVWLIGGVLKTEPDADSVFILRER